MNGTAGWTRPGAAMIILIGLILGLTAETSSAPTSFAARGVEVEQAAAETPREPSETDGEADVAAGVVPAALRIAKIGMDAEVEQAGIVDGVMEAPTGPWVVAWYKETARLGEPGNVVMAGHVDYWDVGPAVFWDLKDLAPGDEIAVTGKDGEVFTYRVEWLRTYDAEDAPVEEILGPTPTESLTLITCAGTFNSDAGEYESRLIVRATRVASS